MRNSSSVQDRAGGSNEMQVPLKDPTPIAIATASTRIMITAEIISPMIKPRVKGMLTPLY
jgi:hypothetical protein